jgi:hypothetical protein
MHCFISVFVGHCFLFFLGLKRRATLVTLVAVFSLGTICLHAQRSQADSIQKQRSYIKADGWQKRNEVFER